MAESADTLRQEIRRRGPVPADRVLVDEYRAKLAEFEKALRNNQCPPPPSRSCADLAAYAETVRQATKDLISPPEPTGMDVADFIIHLPIIVYYWPWIPVWIANFAAQKQEQLEQNRVRLAEVEQAMRKNGCPAELPMPSDKAQEAVTAPPEKPIPLP